MPVRGRKVDPERESWTASIQRHLRPQRVAQLWFSLDEGARQFLQTEIIQQEIGAWHGKRPIYLVCCLSSRDGSP